MTVLILAQHDQLVNTQIPSNNPVSQFYSILIPKH